MIEKAIVSLLTAADTVAVDRITPLQLLRDPDLPAITYQRISTPRQLDHTGDRFYTNYRLYINCWARRTEDSTGFRTVRQLAGEVRKALHGFHGTAAGVDVGLILITGDRDEVDPDRQFERVLLEAAGNYREEST